MLLTVDVGNTNTVFAVFRNGEVAGQWRMSTSGSRTDDEYAVWLFALFEREGIHSGDISGAILSTVVPDAQFSIRQLCKKYFNTEPMIVGSPDIELGIGINIERPKEVGADRLVNAVEAWRRFKRACIIIDFGTATTFDLLDTDGNYSGGVIAPGVNLSLSALHRATAKLPSVRITDPGKVIGTSTVSAMQSGMYYGYVGMIEGIISRMRKEYAKPLKVIATGGLATLYARSIPDIDETIEDLTIFGLHTIYALNGNV